MNTCASTGFGGYASYFQPTSCVDDSAPSGGSGTSSSSSSNIAGGYTLNSQNCVSSTCDVACVSGYTITSSGSSFTATSTGSCAGATCAVISGSVNGNTISGSDTRGGTFTGTLNGNTLTLAPVGGGCSATYTKTSSDTKRSAVHSALLSVIAASAYSFLNWVGRSFEIFNVINRLLSYMGAMGNSYTIYSSTLDERVR
jgi:hypothetical protein